MPWDQDRRPTCLIALALAGCGAGDRERDVAGIAERFHAALAAGDGQAACDQLSEETASTLEQAERKPCEEAILGLEMPKGGTVAVTAGGRPKAPICGSRRAGTDFLDEGPTGWRISAAGLHPPPPERPYECELEG